MRKIVILLLLISTHLHAQTKKYQSEYAKGYRGGFIREQVSRDNALEFAVIGDFGRGGEYFQKDVAATLAQAVTGINAAFIVATGDNIYPDGVASPQDPLWRMSFEDVFYQYPLHRAWYAVLGNHDYHGNAQAQVDYSRVSQRWHMPARYYAFKRKIAGGDEVLFVFLDTNTLDPEAYTSPYAKELLAQDSTMQIRWLEKTLQDSARWKIVVGHHPCYTAGNRALNTPHIRNSLEPLLEKYKVDMYISGHEHHLQYLHPQGKYTRHFISGAGSEANEQLQPRGAYDFFAPIQGFMTFSVTADNVSVQAISRKGEVLKTLNFNKQ
ncbi:tartrate-resistant acid phosphatase type 5 family protein [Chitinophaga sp. sic0106]|uniref:purple acid phosphatase family protein n=1 Tax=Chitinophaga sp. sic0106 TaxID=2854785 RepID=UPI001C46C8E5|nr:tartrate-resistant acid phosphatase type 5 family protein [Chitinophaga sp. sic0106]MBV7530255.1 metallophosphoesterase [Chitinophaga sp. sic0106]